MPADPIYIDLGQVAGRDARIVDPLATYVNDGGDPGVEISMVEIDTEPDEPQQVQFLFNFFNLVNDPLTSAEIEAISNDEVVTSSNTMNGTGATTLWQRIKAKFAAKTHSHSAEDIVDGTLDIARIENGSITGDKYGLKSVGTAALADNAVGSDQLTQALRDSISQVRTTGEVSQVIFDYSSANNSMRVHFNLANGKRKSFSFTGMTDYEAWAK